MTAPPIAAALLACACVQAQSHYIFFNRDRDKIATPAFLNAQAVEGAQLKYTWRELEPREDHYDFEPIRRRSRFPHVQRQTPLPSTARLILRREDRQRPRIPARRPVLSRRSRRQYLEEGRKRIPDGWVARRWDPAVRRRFHKLLEALGREFDGKIAGINLAETSIGVVRDETPDFDPALYRDAVIENIRALKRAFPKSVAMQYANFMPDEWLPGDDKGYLRSVYQAAQKLGAAVGGPDLLPLRKGQLSHAYPLIAAAHGKVPTGIAVQQGNYSQHSTVKQLYQFAREPLKVDFVFWFAEEPFYSRDVLPFLQSLKR